MDVWFYRLGIIANVPHGGDEKVAQDLAEKYENIIYFFAELT